ncbi:MAG: PAS domain S-box protein, partial [Anaerolineales bacterium]|nr:PAS domain S-box protein [Anaerolineales bacterium]
GTSFPGEISISQFEVNGRKTFIASIRDVTERKRAEEALRESEQRYRDIFNGVQDAIFVESRDLRILAVNDRACEMFGYSREEFLTKTVADLVPPGQPIMMGEADSISPTPIETYNLRANGERFPIEISGRMQTINGEDILLIIVRDITERKQAEDEIRRMKEFDETLLNNMSEGIVVQNADGYFIYANPAAAAMSGYPLEEFLGAHWTKYFPANQHEIIKKADDLRARGANSQYEIDFLHRNGKRVNILVSGSPILESGRFNGSIAVFTDISERKQAEEQIQRQLKRLNALRMIDIAISSSFDLTFILDIVLQHVLLQLGADAAAVLLLSPNLQTLEYAASLGFLSEAVRNANVKIGEGYAGRAVLERRLIHISRLMESKGELAEALRTANDGFADYYVAPLIVKGEVKGALEVYHRSDLDPDPEWLDFMETLAGQAAIAIDNAQLLVTIQRSNRELMTAYDATIAGWSHAMDLRDKETEGHTLRVTELTLLLAERMGINQQELIHMRRGALLHDIGKLGVPDHILLKSDTLTEEEWEIMRQHPTYAYEMLLPINYLHPALDIPHAHHEKWDGSGYPRKLKAEQIPLAARLFAVVDVWDALRSDRPYRGKWSVERTREYILEQSGKYFDPQVVAEFMRMLDEMPELI